MVYTASSICSGMGGIDLAFRCAGFRITHQVEIDSYCRRVLHKNFPDAIQLEDMKHAGKHNLPANADVLFGGPPCQPYSIAGKRKGETDDRHLWPEMARVIRETRPRTVLFENVANAINMVLPLVLSDLESAGYTPFPPLVIPACAIGAPHPRDRVFVVAHASSVGRCEPQSHERIHDRKSNVPSEKFRRYGQPSSVGASREAVGNAHSFHRQAQRQMGQSGSRPRFSQGQSERAGYRARWEHLYQSRMGIDVDGLSVELARHRWPAGQGATQFDYEPPRTIPNSSPNWANAVRAIGNAVVPQVVYPLALAIHEWLEAQDSLMIAA